MPIYEYVCQDCHHSFELLTHGGEEPHCPECESERLEQQYSAFAVGTAPNKGRFGKSAGTGACGSCGDPRGSGSCKAH